MIKQGHKESGNFENLSGNSLVKSRINFPAIMMIAIISMAIVVLWFTATIIFTPEQMYIVTPLLAACVVFGIFSYVLKIRARADLFGEIGFIYLGLAMVYTISPAIKILLLNFNLPPSFDSLQFAALSPQPAEIGTHFWRHVLFIAGVAAGYLAMRGGPMPLKSLQEASAKTSKPVIVIFIALIVCCVCVDAIILPPASTYLENYTRLNNLPTPLRKVIDVTYNFRTGGYFVLLALMFSEYRRYKILIYILLPILCTYDLVFSHGSRIVAFTTLMAALGFYHFQVAAMSLKKSMILLTSLAIIFSAIGFIRAYYSEDAQPNLVVESSIAASEFEAVYCTGFDLYHERELGTLPPRDWRMFFNDFIAIIPFLDHIKYNPQYWYASNYFPWADVPPTTMGVIADSAIWGGEWDLLVRSLINGALFALLARWFFRHRDKWWVLAIYVYYWTFCVMTLKYSVLFELATLCKVIIPFLLLTEVLLRVPDRNKKGHASVVSYSREW